MKTMLTICLIICDDCARKLNKISVKTSDQCGSAGKKSPFIKVILLAFCIIREHIAQKRQHYPFLSYTRQRMKRRIKTER